MSDAQELMTKIPAVTGNVQQEEEPAAAVGI
jgi:hypothetical protein